MLPTNRINLLRIFALLLFLFAIAIAPMVFEVYDLEGKLLVLGLSFTLSLAGIFLWLKKSWMRLVISLILALAAILSFGSFVATLGTFSFSGGLNYITIGMFLSFISAFLFFQNNVVKAEFNRSSNDRYFFEQGVGNAYKTENKPDLIKVIGLMMLGYTAIWGFSVGLFLAENKWFYGLVVLTLLGALASILFIFRVPIAKKLMFVAVILWIGSSSVLAFGLATSFGEFEFLWMCYISVIASPIIMVLLLTNELVLWLFNDVRINSDGVDDILDAGLF